MEKMRVWMLVAAAGMLFLLGGCVRGLPADTTTPRMTVEELKSLLGNPSVIVVDVRLEDEWKVSRWKIKGAVREDPEKDIDSWVGKYPKDKTLVFYCSGPSEETSAWVARQFLSRGFEKVYALKGGWNSWVKADFPIEEKGGLGPRMIRKFYFAGKDEGSGSGGISPPDQEIFHLCDICVSAVRIEK